MSSRENTLEAHRLAQEFIIGSSLWSFSRLRRQVVDWGVSTRPEDPSRPSGELELEILFPNPIDEHQLEVAHKLAEKLRLFDLVECIGVTPMVYDDMWIR